MASPRLKTVLMGGQQTPHCEKLLSPKPQCWLGLHVPSCPLLTDGKEPNPSICSPVLWEGAGARTDLAGATVTVGVSQAASLSVGYLAPGEAPAIQTYSVVDDTESKSSSQRFGYKSTDLSRGG